MIRKELPVHVHVPVVDRRQEGIPIFKCRTVDYYVACRSLGTVKKDRGVRKFLKTEAGRGRQVLQQAVRETSGWLHVAT